MKRLLSFLLSVMLILSVVPMGLFSITASAVTATSGTTGDCTWTLDGTVLTISGNGEMGNYYSEYNYHPWNDITKVVIDYGVKNIGDYAFYNCNNLLEVKMPTTIEKIGICAFEKCNKIENLILPESLTEIQYFAFRDCSSLKTINIPKSIKYILNDAFSNCKSIERVDIIDLSSWCNIIFSTSGSNPLSNLSYLYLNNSSISHLVIPSSVTKINANAFKNCYNLTSVIFSNSITEIGEMAFSGCCNLKKIIIPNGTTNIRKYAFYNCEKLEEITLPKSVCSISDFAFTACYSLDNVFYEGGKADREKISFNSYNKSLESAVWHYNTCTKHYYSSNTSFVCSKCGYIRDIQEIPFSGGSGTKNDPYLISNKYQLHNIRYNLSGNFKLLNDISFEDTDFSKYGYFYNENMGWIPIGYYGNEFTGSIDGDNYKIINLQINVASANSVDYAGLICINNGLISNLILSDASLSGGNINANYKMYTGLIAGINEENGRIQNCHIESNCSIASLSYGEVITGGFVGINNGIIENCCIDNAISSVNSLYSNVNCGGIVGVNLNGIILKCNNKALMFATSSSANGKIFLGGIVGYSSGGEIEYCNNNSTINANDRNNEKYKSAAIVGGISGQLQNNSVIKYSTNFGNIKAYSSENITVAGGIVGNSSDASTKIQECYNKGDIESIALNNSKSSSAGGISGALSGEIFDSFNTGMLCAKDFVGGIVGFMNEGCSVKNTYNIGRLNKFDEHSFLGGIAGARMSGKLSSNYYVNNVEEAVGYDNIKGEKFNSTDLIDFEKPSTFLNFDFKETWFFSSYGTYKYPQLKSLKPEYTPGDLDGDEGITDSDVLYLLKHTFRPEKYPVNQPCDYNGDGEITDADAVYLLKHIFRPEKYPLTK